MRTAAIIGAGNVGRAFGERLVRAHAKVRFGVREPAATEHTLTGPLAGAVALPLAAAAAEVEVNLLAVSAAVAVKAAQSAGDLAGKILVDCTNPVRWDRGPVWSPPPEGSVTHALAAALPAVRVIKGCDGPCDSHGSSPARRGAAEECAPAREPRRSLDPPRGGQWRRARLQLPH